MARKMVLDTSVFVNPEISRAFGPNPTEALKGFLRIASRVDGAEFYMPSSIFAELMSFVDVKKVPPELPLIIKRRSPKKSRLTIPAQILYDLIEEIRSRINKGLRLAEEAIKKVETVEHHAPTISELRRKYKAALREGIIDSKEDVDLILLAKEFGEEGAVITADEGIRRCADDIGVEWIDPKGLKEMLKSLAKS